MSILERIRRIVKANVHDLLDKVDTPELEIQSKVDELQRALGEARRALAGFAVTHKRLEAERGKLQAEQKDLQVRSEAALRAGDETRARDLISQRLRAGQRLAQVIPAAEKSAATYAEMKNNLVAVHEQLEAARTRLAELRSRKRAAEARRAAGEQLEQARDAAARAVGFERMEQDVAAAETDLEIQEEIRNELGGIDRKPEHRELEAQVDKELAAMKQNLG